MAHERHEYKGWNIVLITDIKEHWNAHYYTAGVEGRVSTSLSSTSAEALEVVKEEIDKIDWGSLPKTITPPVLPSDQHIALLLRDLQKANANKEKSTARAIRVELRRLGHYISKQKE